MNFSKFNQKSISIFLSFLVSIFCLGGSLGCLPAHAVLDSWNATSSTRQTIIDFVDDVIDNIPEEERIAVFDNDGTLWSEYPHPFQLDFIQNDQQEKETTDNYIKAAKTFLTTQKHPKFDKPYVDLIYQPMVELLDYLRDNDFQIYICSGGDIDFVRSFAEDYYGIPPQNVIGSLAKIKFDNEQEPSALVRTNPDLSNIQNFFNDLDFFNDKENKPVSIERYIGKRPIMAVGNSNGDLQMLQYTDDEQSPSLMMLVKHDDKDRERYQEDDTGEDCCPITDLDSYYDCTKNPYCHVNEVLEEAQQQDDWHLISVKNDFGKVFRGADLD